MKILAFDTSTKFLSIALLEDENVVASFHEDMGIRHSEVLISTIGALIADAEWDINDIGLIAVGLGPGSFTGLRIGIATVKALAASTGCKVVGVPTMDAMVMNVKAGNKLIAPFLDAHKGKVYSCIYRNTGRGYEKKTEYLLVTVDDLLSKLEEEVVFFGDGLNKYTDLLISSPLALKDEEIDWYPRASNVGLLGYERSKEKTDDPETIDPLYLHAEDCSVKKRDA